MSSNIPAAVEQRIHSLLLGAMGPREDKVLSRMRRSDDPVEAELFGLLHRPARRVVYGAAPSSGPAYRLFKRGFSLGETTHRAFGGETAHFDLSPKDLSSAYLEGVAAWWQWKIDEMRARNEAAPPEDAAERARVIEGLQALLDEAVRPLASFLRRHPAIACVVLDVY